MFAARDRLEVEIALTVAEFEATNAHALDGALTMPAWLRAHTDCDPETARRIVAMGRKLRRLPVLRDAALAGSITGGQLQVILANVSLKRVDLFAEHEPELVPTLVDLDVEQTRRAMESWRRHADAVDERPPPAEHDNEVHLGRTIYGRGELHGSLDSDTTALADAALRVADPKDDSLTLAERRGAAFAQILQFFLDNQQSRVGGRHRPHLNVTITYEEFCEGLGGRYLDSDLPVTPAGLGVLLCDSVLHRLRWSAKSGILDYGRATRFWPVDLYNAIAIRDGGCRFPGCDAPASWCDVHHVHHVEDGGPTSIDNGVMLCRHHRRLHTPGFTLKLLPDGHVKVTFPDDRVEHSQPRGPGAPAPLWRQRVGGS